MPPSLPPAAAQWLALLAAPDEPICAVGLLGNSHQVWVDAPRLAVYASKWQAQGRSVYAALHGFDPVALPIPPEPSVCPWSTLRAASNPRARRLSVDVRSIRCLCVDVDRPENGFLGRLDTAGPRPTAVVETSPGKFQALWILERHLPATEWRDWYKAATRALCERFGGDRAVVGDLARVFRVPGYVNTKYPEAPVSELRESDPARRYSAEDLSDWLGIPARPMPPARPRPATRPESVSGEWSEADKAYRAEQWARVLAALPPLEFNAGKSQQAMKRAVMLAADWGWTEDEAPAALAPWLAAATVHPSRVPNPDEQDRAEFVRRLYRNVFASRENEWGVRILEHRHAAAVAEWPWEPPPPPETPVPDDPPPAAPVALDGTLDNAARDFLASYGSPAPAADVDGRLYTFDPARGVLLPVDPEELQRTVIAHFTGRAITDPNRPQSPRVWQWRTSRHVKDQIEMILSLAAGDAPPRSGGICFSDGMQATLSPSGSLVVGRGAAGERAGIGMHHYAFPLDAPRATPPAGFAAFLEGALPADEIQWLREWMGAAIVGHARRLAVFPVLQGAPATGKSVLLNILKAAINETVAMNSPKDLDREYFRAGLHDARLLIMPDNVDAKGFRHLKSLVSDDVPCRARHPYGRVFTPRISCAVALATNQRLVLGEDPTDGIWRRLCPLVFRRGQIAVADQRDILSELRDEIPDVVRWAVGGALDLSARGWRLPQPEGIARERDTWQRNGNGFLEWWASQNQYQPDPTGSGIDWGQIYQNYRDASSHWGGGTLGIRRAEVALRWALGGDAWVGEGYGSRVKVKSRPFRPGVLAGGKP